MLKPKSVLRVLSKADVAIERLQELIAEQRAIKLKAIRRLAAHCSECKNPSPLHLWTFIQDRYYVQPSGCTGGDYWVDSFFQHCNILCPACNKRNRIDFRSDMETLIEIRKKTHFTNEELFDPKIVVEAESQRSY